MSRFGASGLSEMARRLPRAWRSSAQGPTIFALLLAVTAWTIPDYGLTWDEPYYFFSQDRQREWFDELSTDPSAALRTDRLAWGWREFAHHNPHPPFYKLAANLTGAIASPPLDRVDAYRLAPALFFAGTGWLLFGMVRRRHGPGEAALATALWASTPRVFAHAHFAVTDTPMTFFAVATLAAFLQFRERPRRAWILGVVFGTALATKFTALLLPAPWLAWVALRRDATALKVCLIAGAVALPVAVIWNPGWWAAPFTSILEYVSHSATRSEHAAIQVLHFGEIHAFSGPWTQPLVMLAVATPATLTISALAGLVSTLRRRREHPESLLFAVAACVPIAIVMLPFAPNHDGVRLFLAAFPFLGALAARGLCALAARLARVLAGPLRRDVAALARACSVTFAALAIAAQATATARLHPYELSHYNGLIGGLAGASARGLETTYWMEALSPKVLRAIEFELPRRAEVNLVVGDPYYFSWLQAAGRLRQDIVFGTRPDARFHLVVFRGAALGMRSLRELAAPDLGATVRYEVAVEGVPLVRLLDARAEDVGRRSP